MLPQLLLLFAECITVPETRHGELEVVAVDIFGQRVKVEELDVFHTDGTRIMSMRRGQKLPKLRYGTYRLSVRSSGFFLSWADVNIAQPHTVLRTHLEISVECGPPRTEVSGRVRGHQSGGELWVKAIPLRGGGGYETRAERNGRFQISGLSQVPYVLLIVENDKVVHQQIIVPKEPLTIQLQ